MALTQKQHMFIEEYLIDLNASQAAVRAGYSPASRKYAGRGLLARPEIRAAIDARIAERGRQLALDRERVLLEVARLAFNDPRRLFGGDGRLLPVADWPDDVAAAVASVKVAEIKGPDGETAGVVKEIRFWDKGKQLELAARHLGMLHDRLEVSTPLAELIRTARRRIRQPAGEE